MKKLMTLVVALGLMTAGVVMADGTAAAPSTGNPTTTAKANPVQPTTTTTANETKAKETCKGKTGTEFDTCVKQELAKLQPTAKTTN